MQKLKSIITMSTKLHSALELMKLWNDAHYGDFLWKPVMAKPILVKNQFQHLTHFSCLCDKAHFLH